MYIVNGKETTEIRSIPPEDIENVEMLPADEETIARYGQRAVHGVMLITLRYDQPATFPADSTFGHYIASRVRWDASEPAARVVLRYKVTPEGDTVVHQELESTDKRLKRRVLKAVAEAPRWTPGPKERRARSRAKACCASSSPRASACRVPWSSSSADNTTPETAEPSECP